MIVEGCTPFFVILVLVACWNLGQVQSQCSIPSGVALTNETAPPGTVLFTLTKGPATTVIFSIDNKTLANAQYRAELKDFFLLTWSGNNGTFSINKTLDLEEFASRFNGADLTSITVELKCDSTSNQKYINIQPLNEFAPTFQNSPYYLTLDELTPLPTTVFTLQGKVKDTDIPTPSTFFYGIERFLITELDGSNYFDIGASTIGNIKLVKRLDYNDKKYLRLNITVKDSNGPDAMHDSSTIYINITDADNQNPYFNLTGCPKPCIAAPYFAVTTLTYTGGLTIRPEPFQVSDDDTLGTRIFYSIQSGDDRSMFTIDRNTGTVTQTQSVNDVDFPGAEVRLVIQAKKNTTLDLSNIAILTVRIAGRTPVNNSDIPPVGKSTEKKDSSLLIPVIVLGIILVLLIVAIVIIVLIARKKHREASVRPDPDTKSEPQTEEEELHSEKSGGLPKVGDFNGKLVMNGKTTQGMSTDPLPPTPDGRANKLPPLPLRDSATETMDGRRKKRSRKRNKNKEPEIFDGTREYNMGEDPEFFDSTDKSKVKRSQRSYDKKVDPALWIKVPNDNPQNDDSGFSG